MTSCTKRKGKEPAKAKHLYRGPVRRLFDLADKLNARCYVLSAKHGLISCEDVIAPYDVYLGGLTREQIADLKRRISERCGVLEGPWRLSVIHLSSKYASIIDCNIVSEKALVIGSPPKGLKAGRLKVVKYKTLGERARLLASLDELLSQL